MNPLMLFKTLRDLSALIEQANRLAGPDKRWSLAFTNRSFIVACVALVAAAALMLGLPFPMPIDITAETIYAVITVAGLLWSGIERMLGKTQAVWNKKQAVEAVVEADALTTALNKVPVLRAQQPR
ncbi:hypothetical protein [Paracoccus haeundaensis]|uniref:Uncharacterized protein n=1 Tax=Paracoccus haeundaensis TaxID=225362 RepID=A0A5C4R6U7_9RHOB|nr:hypothetical protein [Paracoccus haeundaensis]TNH39401.1 hypothetical protein FHD67_09500 [Paracoccus haeundaensis]